MRWMLTWVTLVMVTVAGLACGPDLKGIHLSDCMKACNVQTKTCLSDKETALDACQPSDDACQHQAIHDTETCLTTSLDCIAVCAGQVEQQLKK
jgi:hypothetical protein